MAAAAPATAPHKTATRKLFDTAVVHRELTDAPSNMYPDHCAWCGSHVAAGAGVIVGSEGIWFVRCAYCDGSGELDDIENVAGDED